VDRDAEPDEDIGAAERPPKEENDSAAGPTRPQPASAEVTIANVNREAKAALNLFKKRRSSENRVFMINTFVRTFGQTLIT